MLHFPRRWFRGALFFSCMLLTAIASAATPEVKDGAKFFSNDAVKEADKAIQEIQRTHHVEVVIETFPGVPAARTEEVRAMNAEARGRFVRDWAKERMHELDVKGIYVLICRSPAHLEVHVSPDTAKKGLPKVDSDKLIDLLLTRFKAKDHDKGLVDAVHFVRDRLDENTPAEKVKTAPAEPEKKLSAKISEGVKSATKEVKSALQADAGPGFTWGTVAWIIVGLLALWIVIGILRALFGGRKPAPYVQAAPGPTSHPASQRPVQGAAPMQTPAAQAGGVVYGPPASGQVVVGPGYGPGMGGGGGGGGFMSGVLGGMFGAAAGNWIYDRFARGPGPSPQSWSPPVHHTQPVSQPAAPPPDYGTIGKDDFDDERAQPPQSTGGDFGDDSKTQAQSAGGDFGDDAQEQRTGGDFGDDAEEQRTGGDFGDDAQEQTSGGDFDNDAGAEDQSGGDFDNEARTGGDFGEEQGGSDFGQANDTGGDFDSGGDSSGGDFGGGGDES
jgi:uncharacterized protein